MYRIETDTPVGRLALGSDGNALCYCLPWGDGRDIADGPPDNICHAGAAYLTGYFAGTLRSSDIPINPAGTDFRKRVWLATCGIGYGTTVSYGDIARLTGSHESCRAVGSALGANPLIIFVPCHRVIKADGTPGGFALGNAVKEYLLEWERRIIACDQ